MIASGIIVHAFIVNDYSIKRSALLRCGAADLLNHVV
jgi:hypothetical protein